MAKEATEKVDVTERLIRAAIELREALRELKFRAPVTHVYSPLDYAWEGHRSYLQRYGQGRRRVMFLGMNPGPFGMAQTGVPFGEISAVREWLRIIAAIGKPNPEHPRRLVSGFACARTEISGRRLWGLFAERFGTPEAFFADHIVMNYCPLAFLEQSGCNRTPDKLPAGEKRRLFELCDSHLSAVLSVLGPEWVVGIGDFATNRAREVARGFKVARILHPSPASPAANRDWAGVVTRQLQVLGIWK